MRKMGVLVAVLIVVIGVGVGFALLHQKAKTPSSTNSTQTTTTNNTSPQSSNNAGNTLSGTKYSVSPTSPTTVSNGQSGKATMQLLGVYDGVTASAAPQVGYKYDAVQMKVTNENTNGNALPASDLLQDMALTGSDGKTYYAASARIENCSDFSANDQVGQTIEGCLTFSLPSTVTPAKLSIDFIGSQQASAEASWTVAKS